MIMVIMMILMTMIVTMVTRLRLALKPKFLSKGLASQSVKICVFVAYRVSGHSIQDN